MRLTAVFEQAWIGINALMERSPYLTLSLIFVCAFLEGLPILSLLVPALSLPVLVHLGLKFGVSWIAISIAVWLGIVWAYLLGYFGGRYCLPFFEKRWPLSSRPELLVAGRKFFNRWGYLGVIASAFSKPLRAVVPLVAGCCKMPKRDFFLANIVGGGLSTIWNFLLALYGGTIFCQALNRLKSVIYYYF